MPITHIALIPLLWDIVILWVYIFVHINKKNLSLCACVCVCVRVRVCVCMCFVNLFLCIISFLSSYKYIYHNIIYLCLLMAKIMFSADFANKL